MPSIANPLWLLLPLLALAVFLIFGRQRVLLPGSWHRAIDGDLQAFLSTSVESIRSRGRILALFGLWLGLGAALSTISFGQVDIPKLRNLDARVVVIDLGLPDRDRDRISAARYLIDSAEDVPTAVVAVTENAFDVVPLTRDEAHLDRYLQVLTHDVMPIEGRSLYTGIERAIALLDRAGIQARQITVFTGDTPPPRSGFLKPDHTKDHNIWLVLPNGTASSWQGFADDIDATIAGDQDIAAIQEDFEERRRDAATKAVSIRERRDVTPWLIAFMLPLWLWLFCRRQGE
jgi:hypothetical protein